MVLHIRALALLSFLALLCTAAPANAATVNFTGLDYNMGMVEAGDEGIIRTKTREYEDGYAYDFAKGILPKLTAITFTYTFSALTGNNGYVQGEVKYKDGPWRYFVADATDGWSMNQKAFKNNPLHDTNDQLDVSVIASMADDKESATVTITNFSDFTANFKSYFFACDCFWTGKVSTTYAVTSVPLPAALPLFGLGLAGLVGVRRWKNRRA